MNTSNILLADASSDGGGLSGISGNPHDGDAPSTLEQLLHQATALAKQLQRERAILQGIGRTDGRPAVKALQQQIVQVWNAIRAARSSGGSGSEVVRRRYKWD